VGEDREGNAVGVEARGKRGGELPSFIMTNIESPNEGKGVERSAKCKSSPRFGSSNPWHDESPSSSFTEKNE
jgi:hypothetical protein